MSNSSQTLECPKITIFSEVLGDLTTPSGPFESPRSQGPVFFQMTLVAFLILVSYTQTACHHFMHWDSEQMRKSIAQNQRIRCGSFHRLLNKIHYIRFPSRSNLKDCGGFNICLTNTDRLWGRSIEDMADIADIESSSLIHEPWPLPVGHWIPKVAGSSFLPNDLGGLSMCSRPPELSWTVVTWSKICKHLETFPSCFFPSCLALRIQSIPESNLVRSIPNPSFLLNPIYPWINDLNKWIAGGSFKLI